MTFNAGVEAAAKVMDDLDRGGWFAEAIRARAMQRDEITDDIIVATMVEAAAKHLGLEVKSDDPNLPAVQNCMKSVMMRLRVDGIISEGVEICP